MIAFAYKFLILGLTSEKFDEAYLHYLPAIFVLASMVFRMLFITNVCEGAYNAVKDSIKKIICHEIINEKRIQIIVERMKTIEPLSGNGFFEVKKPTVTTIIGAAVTYMIILVQFKLSEVSKPSVTGNLTNEN